MPAHNPTFAHPKTVHAPGEGQKTLCREPFWTGLFLSGIAKEITCPECLATLKESGSFAMPIRFHGAHVFYYPSFQAQYLTGFPASACPPVE